MMKLQRYISAAAALLAILFTSCTLMLDEPPISDENKEEETENGDGFSAPCTEMTEYGPVTYQYQEGVRLLGDDYRPYVMSAQTDTASGITRTYFAPGIPADKLPQHGEVVTSTLLDIFTYNLLDEVDVVEKADVGYCMISHSVSINRIFKELEFDFEGYLVTEEVDDPNIRPSSIDGKRRRFDIVGCYSKPNTRESEIDDEDKEGDVDDDVIEFDDIFINLTQGDVHFIPYKLGTDGYISSFKYLFKGIKPEDSKINPLYQVIKFGLVGDFDLYASLKSRAKINMHYSLLKWELDGGLIIRLDWGYGMKFKKIGGAVSIPLIGTDNCSMTTENKDIFPSGEFDSFIVQPEEKTISRDLKILKIGIALNVGIVCDFAIEHESVTPFLYERNGSTILDLGYSSKKGEKGQREIETKPRKQGSVYISSSGTAAVNAGFRINGHFSMGIFVEAKAAVDYDKDQSTGAKARLTPFEINVDGNIFTMKHCEFEGGEPTSVSNGKKLFMRTDGSFSKSRAAYSMNFNIYKAEVESKLSNFLKEWNIFDLSGAIAEGVGGTSDSYEETTYEYPNFNTKFIYNELASMTEGKPNYDIEVKAKEGIYENSDFRNIGIIILDEDYKFVAEAKPRPGYENPVAFDPKATYKFNVTVDPDKLTSGAKQYFRYVVVLDSPDGKNSYFVKPDKNRFQMNYDFGEINKIQPLFVTGYDNPYGTSVYDGIAFDTTVSLRRSGVTKGYVRVEFFSGETLLSYPKNDYLYSVTLVKDFTATTNGICLCKHSPTQDITKVRVTLFYKKKIDNEEQEIILDKQELDYTKSDANTWPEFDLTNKDVWTKKGYTILYIPEMIID